MITKNIKQSKSAARQLFGGNSSGTIYIQFIPGHVTDVTVNQEDKSAGNYLRNINKNCCP